MKKAILAVNIVLCALLVLMFALSVADTEEVTRKTEMDTTAISQHIEKLSENGPRSLFHPKPTRRRATISSLPSKRAAS